MTFLMIQPGTIFGGSHAGSGQSQARGISLGSQPGGQAQPISSTKVSHGGYDCDFIEKIPGMKI